MGFRNRVVFHGAAALLGLSFGLTFGQSCAAGVFSSRAEDDEALTQRRTALMQEIGGMARVNQVIYRLETAAVPLCEGDAAANPGFAVAARDRFPEELRDAAQSLGYGRQARVMYVAGDSPAAHAGLYAGDVVRAVNGQAIQDGDDAHAQVEGLLARVQPGGNVELTVARGDGQGETQNETLSFAMPQACNYAPHLIRSHVVNAATADWEIHVTTALLDFIDSDAELAAVLAHEIAHSMMNHVARRLGNQVLGKMLDAVLGAVAGPAGSMLVSIAAPGERLSLLAYSQDFEREADYVAMYVLARAGYALRDSPGLWRKLAVEFPQMQERSYFATHPATPERILIQQLTIEEINAKLAANAPLLPELKQRVAEIKQVAQ